MTKAHPTFSSLDMLAPLMNHRKLNDHEIAPPLGNGCFNYPTSTTTVLTANPSVPEDLLGLSARRSPTKSRMETFYLPSKEEDEHIVVSRDDGHHQTSLQPSTIRSLSLIHLDQMVEDKAGDLLDLSPGWRFRMIKKIPITHAADSIRAKYPSLSLSLCHLQHQQQGNPFPATMTTIGIWTPWWFPAHAPITVASTSSVSSLSSIYLIPCDMPSSSSLSSYLDDDESKKNAVKIEDDEDLGSDSNQNLFTNNNYSKKAQEGYLTTSTAADAVPLTAMARQDLYKDTIFPYTTFSSANSSTSISTSTSRSSSRSGFQSLLDTQEDISQDVQQHESEQQGQDEDFTIFDNEILIAVQRLSTVTNSTTTSMELADPLGASSPTLTDLPSSSTESTNPSPVSHPGDNSILSKDGDNALYQGFPALSDTVTGNRVSIPSYSFPSSPPVKGLGIGLSYLNYHSSSNSTPSRMSWMPKRRTWPGRIGLLVQMLRLDEEEEEEEKKNGGGEGNDIDDDDSDMGAELVVETGTDVPTSRVASSGSSSTSGHLY
ncbi:MAG: hypothetical protein JOS17DRAFT_772727 [Linnemannia elongata]|nr:MAG: hypothetical protein JOS17DRAFT_772727 [Linnemannia elongata]